MTKKYGFYLDDGEFHEIEGENVMEAFAKLNKRTSSGELDFSRVEEFVFPNMPIVYVSPVPFEEKKEYQLVLKKERSVTSEWEFTEIKSDSFTDIEEALRDSVKYGDYFTGFVWDMNTEKILSWLWKGKGYFTRSKNSNMEAQNV